MLTLVDRLRADRSPASLADRARLQQAAVKVRDSQNSDGGWGPYPRSPSEAFDTALSLLALRGALLLESGDRELTAAAISRGRRYLSSTQLAEGGWPETTRPAGYHSYAQHISTTGWATLALLKTGKATK
jgi:hypothetical protein